MKVKKILSFLTGTVMAFTVMLGVPMNQNEKTLVQYVTAEAAASDFTAEQAVAWANNCATTKWDKDVDGAYGTQCVDLILAYYSYLGVSRSSGNATDYQSNTLPSGWTRVKSSPKPGDVIVWAGNTKINASYTLTQYGHIGIVVAVSGNKLTTVETNADGKVSYAQKLSRDASYAACFIRPNFLVHDDCVNVTTGNYYLKNQSTKTYMQAAGASNAAKLSLAAKKDTSAFLFNLTGSKSAGYYLATKLNTGYVVNPYSDTPTNGTAINIYTKDNSGTQLWEFDKSGSGYIVHLKNNSNLCLTADGTNVVLKSRTDAANQIWFLEDAVTLASVSIATPATYTIYPVGAKIDTSGLTLTLKYSDGSTKNITEGFSASADLSAIGKTKVTVSYEGKTVTYDVEVKSYFDGDGTEESPYLIKSKSDLNTLAAVVNNVAISNSYKQAYYKQTADIDLENEEFTPIGIFYSSETDSLINEIAFDGIYNGGKHSIINLSVNLDSKYSGLFGRTQRRSVIKELSVYGNVTGNGSCTGGIVGEVGYGGKVLNCSFNGTVTGAQLVGGITSSLQGGGTVSGCYANAVVKTKSSGDMAWAGGIVGRPHVGHASNSENAEVSNCYFVGSVSGAVTGGIVGKTVIETTKNNTVTYSNNYFLKSDGLSASGDESVASNNVRALSEELMKNVSELLGTPFALNWSNNLNDGYPVFEWQLNNDIDLNDDGKFNIADVVLFQKWILAVPDTNLANWQAADLNEDGKLNAIDLVMMKRKLINGE